MFATIVDRDVASSRLRPGVSGWVARPAVVADAHRNGFRGAQTLARSFGWRGGRHHLWPRLLPARCLIDMNPMKGFTSVSGGAPTDFSGLEAPVWGMKLCKFDPHVVSACDWASGLQHFIRTNLPEVKLWNCLGTIKAKLPRVVLENIIVTPPPPPAATRL